MNTKFILTFVDFNFISYKHVSVNSRLLPIATKRTEHIMCNVGKTNKFCCPIIKRRSSRVHNLVLVTKILQVVTQSISFVAAWALKGANRELSVTTAEFAVPD
jgi:hypothetical protein